MEYLKIPVKYDPTEVKYKIGFGLPTNIDSDTVISTWDIPGQGNYFTMIELELFGRKLYFGSNFFTNWRNVYRHPIIWFLSK